MPHVCVYVEGPRGQKGGGRSLIPGIIGVGPEVKRVVCICLNATVARGSPTLVPP